MISEIVPQLCVKHLDFLLETQPKSTPLHLVILSSSLIAKITSYIIIKSGDLQINSLPEGPLTLLTIPFLFNDRKICSKKDRDIFCRREISDKLTGLPFPAFRAISTSDVTAILPFDVSFILIFLP